ncbi:hypothetical protein ASG76_05720 [Nocardioides sp. Soil774]|uniref:DUF2550 domain-containing protein n=1 Tax=Nocardioides sp. Soil774 TaxID=1736408 RepID=UPI0006FF4C4C|nr:DUF2550 domain-containing protein [Nocardioides sp. Soil774]KRE95776.1 hypothetical protein ASG76_05720 [Nocardioides sp. Soil774]
MPVWELVLDLVGLVLLLALLYGISLIVRRRLLARHGGTFELSYRVRTEHPGRGWLLGIGRYSGQSLEWFRIFSLSPRPKRVWARDLLDYSGRRAPAGPEEMSLYDGHVVASCHYDGEPLEIAMSEASLTGFQSWLESGPPGTDWNRR